jgi:hypothetical protein
MAVLILSGLLEFAETLEVLPGENAADLHAVSLDSTESHDWFDLLIERHRVGSPVVTCNRRPNEWLARLFT